MPRVCHLSTVHVALDNRIFHKQCRSLARAGYDVTWVVQHPRDEVVDGVQIVGLPKPKSRRQRWMSLGWLALRKAIEADADLYHFHDPELIPQGLVLRLRGKQVVYDIHEDYVSSISQKHYIPKPIRRMISIVAGWAEQVLSGPFCKIIAERYYQERFPDAVPVLNYPVLPPIAGPRCRRSRTRLLYTGKVHKARGAEIHAALPRLVPNTTVQFLGKCSESLHQELLEQNAAHANSLTFEGIGEGLPFSRILNAYDDEWLAGLALFPPNEHLDRKELTKFFEYMQFGIPIIASDFPVWRELVERNQCGICVDPLDEEAIRAAIIKLQGDDNFWYACSQNGIQAVHEHYAWSSQERILLDLYSSLLQLRAKPTTEFAMGSYQNDHG